MSFPCPEPPVLFLDAAAPRLCVGLLGTGEAVRPQWRTTEDEAGIGLFREIDSLLQAGGLSIVDLRTVVFCDGPGSLLGIRLGAMAVRTWMALPRTRPLRVWSYHSLALLAAKLLADGETAPFHVASDGRRETWNVLTVSPGGVLGDVRRCGRTELPPDGRPLFMPDSFPHWQAKPDGIRSASYRPQLLPELLHRFPLLRETPTPDAFMTEMPTYRIWTPDAVKASIAPSG